MYSLNAVPLDNATYGWVLLDASAPLSQHGRGLTTLRLPGRDGVLALPATFDPVPVSLLVETPREHLETLLEVAASATALTRTADSSRTAALEFVAAPLVGFGDGDELVEARLVYRLPGVFWRDTTETTSSAVTLSAASVDVDVMPDLSAPVQDALVRVKGAVTGLRVTDESTGAWFDYSGTLTSSEYLRFDSATGRAWVTSSDVWKGGTEVSGAIDLDGPRGVFEIGPVRNPADPTDRTATLVVTTATRSSASVRVRGRRAYIV